MRIIIGRRFYISMENENLVFKTATAENAKELALIESICFPENEADSYKNIFERCKKAPEYALILWDKDNDKIAGYLNGVATSEDEFRDEFFTDISLHDADAKNIMLLGLGVRPEYRHKGLAGRIIKEYERRQEENGKKNLYLTCHERLTSFYEGFGFKDLGTSGSTWGGTIWNDMVYNCED